LFAHEDNTLFSFLPAPNSEGLQVLNRNDKKWIRLNAPKNSVIFNAGDYLQRITNDVFPSVTHRVCKPSQSQNVPRVSLPFFLLLKEDDIMEVLPGLGEPKYPPIRAEEFHRKVARKYCAGDDTAKNVLK